MKKKKIVTIGLAVLMVCSSVSLIGCGGKSKKSGGEKVIEIAYWTRSKMAGSRDCCI